MNRRRLIIALPLLCVATLIPCDDTLGEILPATDPTNRGGWILVEGVSDEFNGRRLDENKWHIQGTDGDYRSRFIGRAPSQFSTDNVRLEEGMLKLETRWEPSFDFSEKIDRSDSSAKDGRRYENITTAAVISKEQVRYGYFEIRCKAAPASITSAFWMTGNSCEIDVFEFTGRPKQRHKVHLESELWSSIHDWSRPGGPTTWTDRLQLDWKVADGMHTYAMEWAPESLRFYADGQKVREVTKEQVGEEGWIVTKPVWVWVDSETFPWHGVPTEEDLPVDYEIDYIRVWQTPEQQSGGGLMSFEPVTVSSDSKADWWIPEQARAALSLSTDRAAEGERSLKIAGNSRPQNKAVAFSPYGSLSLEPGQQKLSMRVWRDSRSPVKSVRVVLEDPWQELPPFDLTGASDKEWVTIEQEFRRRGASGPKDRVRIFVEPSDIGSGRGDVFIDEIRITNES